MQKGGGRRGVLHIDAIDWLTYYFLKSSRKMYCKVKTKTCFDMKYKLTDTMKKLYNRRNNIWLPLGKYKELGRDEIVSIL